MASFDAGGQNVRYYHFDSLGNTVLVTDGSGAVSGSFVYDAWGLLLSSGGGITPYQWGGEVGCYAHNSETQGGGLGNLAQLGVRYYNAVSGRFTQRDFVGFVGGLNWYEYAGSNPATYIDPWGLCFGGGDNKGNGKRDEKDKETIKDLLTAMASLGSDKIDILSKLQDILKSKENANNAFRACEPFIQDAQRAKNGNSDNMPECGTTADCATCCVALARYLEDNPVAAACPVICMYYNLPAKK